MQLLYKSATPSYHGCAPAPTQATPGLLSSLWCSLFGAAVPAYRTKNGNGAQASAPSRCFWQLSPTPVYQTAPAAPSADPQTAPSTGAAVGGDTCACDAVPTEIHVW